MDRVGNDCEDPAKETNAAKNFLSETVLVVPITVLVSSKYDSKEEKNYSPLNPLILGTVQKTLVPWGRRFCSAYIVRRCIAAVKKSAEIRKK